MEPSDDVLRALLAAAPDALLSVDTDGTIVFANDQVERLFGWQRDDLLGRPIETLVPARFTARHPVLRNGYIHHPTTRPMGAGLELWARRRDGTEFPAEISLSAVHDDDGSTLVLAAVRDVSDRLELEAERQRQALEAQREQSHRLESLGQLAGGIAHDFNNLLGVILNYATLLNRSLGDDEAAQRDVSEIRAAAERGAGLTRQLLTFARRDVVNAEPLELNEVVRGVASMLGRTLGEQVDLRLELVDAPLVTVADRQQIEQIVLNLAINARDALVGGGRVTIVTAARASDGGLDDVVLRVVDTGCGMEPEIVSRVFEPFFTTKPRGQGTGMGLATVHGIVHQAGGEVTVDSEPGRGTTVTVVLRGSDLSAVEPEPRVTERAGGTGRLLLVEDEPSLRVGTARILSANGYHVLAAADGVEALEMFDEMRGEFDLVITDVVMPRMRGDELAEQLCRRPGSPPVLFLSGYDPEDHVPLRGRLLPKPVPEEVLMRTIREVIDAGA